MKLRYLVGYNSWCEDISDYYKAYFSGLRDAGHDIETFCITLNPPGPRLSWHQLDRYWKWGHPSLYRMYERLYRKLENKDVFINWHGSNLHPEFITMLPTFNVFVCNDDPESSDELSRPAAWAYDCAFTGNIAEVESYRNWGIQNAFFLPMGFSDLDVAPGITAASRMDHPRKYDLILFCERESIWRKARLDRIMAAFPNGHYYGRGWPNGYATREKRLHFYANAKIGINIHNSSGPVNARTYQLPANGVLQICDNKSDLGKIFELDKEVIGFDTIDECIDKVKYYLSHEDERIEIAERCLKRVWNDYHFVSIWEKFDKKIKSIYSKKIPSKKVNHLKCIQTKAVITSIPDIVKTAFNFMKKVSSKLND